MRLVIISRVSKVIDGFGGVLATISALAVVGFMIALAAPFVFAVAAVLFVPFVIFVMPLYLFAVVDNKRRERRARR